MQGRLYKIPPPVAEDQGCALVFFCIPNTPDWRRLITGMVEMLTYGRAYDETTGNIKQAQEVGREIFESMCMANCEDFVTQLSRIADGVESISAKLETDNWLAANESIADVLANSLFGRYLSSPIPNPLAGQGIADILDDQTQKIQDQTQTLHGRFRQDDLSLIPPFFGEKNIAETLESLLRKGTTFDIEGQPNISEILDANLKIGDTGLLQSLINRALSWTLGTRDTSIDEQLEQAIAAALGGEGDKPRTIPEILLLISYLMQQAQGQPAAPTANNGNAPNMTTLINTLARLDLTSIVNLNNYNGCCDEADCTCGEAAQVETITLPDIECPPEIEA